MEINKKAFLILTLLALSFVSCQTKKIITYAKYENLDTKKKQEVDESLKDVLKHLAKKENEIALLFQYNCFYNKKLEINNKYSLDFPKDLNNDHYGQKFKLVKKEEESIKIKISDGREFLIKQKKGFDYIGICYYEKEDKLYVEYFDYPRILAIE
ncbi:hypothetical protein [Chryseobacterium sp.]|uniref:hypothetical protein n=1 Tax=Chryseobacterium sp. TaxID=1871047 RepID=UPI000EEEC70A|nr:hypothetical protein [Chryseobacterium sp.]HCM34216.1 hypothetical protein [Chryseobacterium sp.]